MELVSPRAALYVLAALGYAIATIGMKLTAGQLGWLGISLLIVGFLAATCAEVVLMRGLTLGPLYLTIIAVESLLVLVYAFAIGEGLSGPQIAGGAMVLAGVAVLAH